MWGWHKHLVHNRSKLLGLEISRFGYFRVSFLLIHISFYSSFSYLSNENFLVWFLLSPSYYSLFFLQPCKEHSTWTFCVLINHSLPNLLKSEHILSGRWIKISNLKIYELFLSSHLPLVPLGNVDALSLVYIILNQPISFLFIMVLSFLYLLSFSFL